MLQKIDLMEDNYGEPMTFDESRILANVAPMAAGTEIGAWGYGVSVYDAAQGNKREVMTPFLMAKMYGFALEEEMQDTKAYLCFHGGYQLEQVNECLLLEFLVCHSGRWVFRFYV